MEANTEVDLETQDKSNNDAIPVGLILKLRRVAGPLEAAGRGARHWNQHHTLQRDRA